MAGNRSRRRSPTTEVRPGGGWRGAWTVGLLLAGPALAALAWFLFSSAEPGSGTLLPGRADRNRKRTPIRVGSESELVQALPIGPGSLADCNLLLVTLDTTRADRIGCYGNQEIETPTMDRLAREGVLCSRATAVAPTTLPSHASMLTGLYPVHHGVRANGLFRLDDRHETLAERLRSEGFRTGAIVSSFVLDSQFGLAQGFDQYQDDLSDASDPLDRHYRSRSADRTTDRAISWLRASVRDRFFLWVHYFDPHHSYDPPSPFAERYAQNLYDGEIAFVDSELARLLDAVDDLGLSERCLVVVIGDHGEGLAEHQEYTHAYLTYEGTLHVPLLLYCGSRLGPGSLLARPVSQVDLLPTVLSLLGISAPRAGDGVALTESPAVERPVFFETLAGQLEFGWEPLIGVRSGDHKYIHSSVPELYHLAGDPGEQNNRLAADPSTAVRMKALLTGLFGPELELATRVTPTLQPGFDDLERLQALGYLGGGVTASAATPGALPGEMIRYLSRVERARNTELPLEQRLGELQQVLRELPDYYPAWKALGAAYRRSGDLDRAAEALSRCLRLIPEAPQTVYELALVRANQDKSAEVLRLLKPLVREYPDYMKARYLYGSVLGQFGRNQEAADHLKAAFELDPGYERCLEHLVLALTSAGSVPELRTLLEEQLRRDPASTRIRLALASLLQRQKEFRTAAAVLRAGLKLAPRHAPTVNRLALLLGTCPEPNVRNFDQALALLEPFSRSGAEEATLMYTLCGFYAGVGRLDEALALAARARELAEKAGDQKLVAAFDRRLKLIRVSAGRH